MQVDLTKKIVQIAVTVKTWKIDGGVLGLAPCHFSESQKRQVRR